MSDLAKNYRTEELSDEELNRVSGGLNPQPLPPRSPPPGDPLRRVTM
jgi:bacteriocin-like protein